MKIEAKRWTIMHPDQGGPLEVVSASVYDALKVNLDGMVQCVSDEYQASEKSAEIIDQLQRELSEAKATIERLRPCGDGNAYTKIRETLDSIMEFDRTRGYPTGTEWLGLISDIRKALEGEK